MLEAQELGAQVPSRPRTAAHAPRFTEQEPANTRQTSAIGDSVNFRETPVRGPYLPATLSARLL
jgi:hypothetical protein